MRVLMLRALGLGDFLTAVPAYRALRAAYPEHETVLAAPPVLAPLAELTGAIDRLLPAGELERLSWDGPPPEVAVDLHGDGPASHRLVEELSAPLTMLYASPQAPDAKGPWWDPGEHEVTRWCRLPEWYGVPADPGDLRLRSPGPSPYAGAVVLHPGAASTGRRWPAGRFAAVARALTAEGHRVVLTGAPDEQDLTRRVAAEAGLPPDAALETTLAELAAVIASARAVISNDTGTSHLATAYGTPSVTLFGPVSPALWGPPPDRPEHVALWHGTGGRPGDAHGTETDPRLLLITVEEVLDATTRVAGQDRRHRLDR
ncbi:glycosyltransferase family 9 protein [Actinoallomurus sp. CA-142502]|uniref:glycosyltransferase family 9 protein n=1 Tax=Actinoallomurus sp. CA-142502 TaxID=3239885 RepID=UPI003D89F40A